MTRIPEDTVVGLRELLKECTAHVTAANQTTTGTGFFINDRLLLTCAHVVANRNDTTVEVHPYKRGSRPGRVIALLATKEGDLALVNTDPVEGETSPQPAVVLHGDLPVGQYLAAGHPTDPEMGLGLEVIEYAGHPRDRIDPGDPIGLQLVNDQVTFGMSGGPVVSLETGAVVALTRTSKGPNTNLGGGAIPVRQAAEAFETIRDLLNQPPPAARRWRDLVGRTAWEYLGYQWIWESCIEVQIQGNRSRWLVTTDPSGEERYELTVSQLGEEVSEALFQWAQRRRIRTKREVQLLGRLLSAALFPQPLAGRLTDARRADRVLIRLRIDPASDLADIPWEFATVPGKREEFLATTDGVAFVRVSPSFGPARTTPPPLAAQVRILAVISQPDNLRFPDVTKDDRPVPWPKMSELIKQLRSAARGCKVETVENPGLYDLIKAAERRDETNLPYDVFHYIGIGRLVPQGAQLGMCDDQGEHQWVVASEVFDCARRCGARVLVVELVLEPPGRDDEPIPATALAACLQDGQANALVCTRFPVHAREFNSFNTEFYNALSRGDTVEEAVQKARFRLQTDEPMYDAAAFGWFTLITGERAGTRLIESVTTAAISQAQPLQEPTKRPPAEKRTVNDAFTG